MPGHGFQEMRRFRLGQAHRLVARLSHCPVRGPAALRFIDDDDPFGRWVRRMLHVVIAEFRQRLDGAQHFPSRIAAFGTAGNRVAYQRLT